jgi:tRNA-dihydrouridine synthase C
VRRMPFPHLTAGKPALILAPMEGVTDAPMRAVQSERGAFTFCISEFLRVSGTPIPTKVFLRSIPELHSGCKTPSGTPVQIQLLGGDAERVAASAMTAVQLGAQAIDLNFGCPAPTVNRHDGGATLLKYPHRIREIVQTVRKAVPSSIPVSTKMRLGWDSVDLLFENTTAAAEGGTSWITIHGRTRNAGYAPPIDWKPIGEVRKRLHPLPVVANGDIWTIDDFQRCRDITGADHFMLGRGALANQRLPLLVAKELGTALNAQEFDTPTLPTEEWLQILARFEMHTMHYPQQSLFLARRTKQWLAMAHRYQNLAWFEQIKRLPTFESIREAITSFQ